jgi:hypothetical protein
VLNSALTLWIWRREKGVVYVGTAPSGETVRSLLDIPMPYPTGSTNKPQQVTISTSTRKNIPEYHLTITIQPRSKSAKPETFKITRSFTEWFDAAGHFVSAPFQTVLATAIPAVGKLDPKRVAADEKTDSRYTAEMLDALSAATSSEMASGTDVAVAGGNKGGKRRKGQ